MPTTYAHWRFGDRCISRLPINLQEIIKNNREIFDYGVHGPDIFFYYNCLKHNKINEFASNFHHIPYSQTLNKWKQVYQNSADREKSLAYILGFTCHFVLDSYCHGYIERKEELDLVSHGKMESQLDRYFMVKDGLDPIKYPVWASLHPGKEVANVIANFFENFNYDIIEKSLFDCKKYLHLLKDNFMAKRALEVLVMDLTNNKKFKELLITTEFDPRCRDSNERMNKYFKVAVEHYGVLAKKLFDYLQDIATLDNYFDYDFCPKKDYKEIRVLPYEEELNYKVEFISEGNNEQII